MAANTAPIFVDTVQWGSARISTANTNRDGTGTLGDVFTGAADGSRISYIRIMATSTTTAGMIRLYVYDGTNTRLWDEVMVNALTPSATVLGFRATIASPIPGEPLLVLKSTHVLRASTHNAESFDVSAVAGDF